MRILYHTWLSPTCRRVRVMMREKQIEFQLRAENVWERREEFLALNPAGDVPVLIEPDGGVIAGVEPICEYLDEIHPDPPLLGATPRARAEARRLAAWFERKFEPEVTENLVGEKMMKRFLGRGEPSSAAIRAGYANLAYHLDYIAHLIERRRWLAGDTFSIADIAGATHLSCLDYLGDVAWDGHPSVKDWYARIKSRPSFRPLLTDHIAGAPPPKHYADLDF
jgi:glutathione S-transferase